ncbi:MAG: hypothetical protein AAF152_21385 [Cyanobacteria bacterium P01_A01_bin.114]
MPIKILLQTTLLPTDLDDWTIRRFSLLQAYLSSLTDESGAPLVAVTGRDRNPDENGNDPILSTLDSQDVDELWLFALDVGGGLSRQDCEGITRFHQQGGGILATRDHQDMGISMCPLSTIGQFHHFHTQQANPDPDRCCRDDTDTMTIDWPNYHSGSNGDYQTITAAVPSHPLLQGPDGLIQRFPAHPHEGGVSVPKGMPHAQVIATGKSQITERDFNLVVAADRSQDKAGQTLGRVVAQSTFHHFVDYNWDIERGCPSFVEEPPGQAIKNNPDGLKDIQTYVRNLALWLAPTH